MKHAYEGRVTAVHCLPAAVGCPPYHKPGYGGGGRRMPGRMLAWGVVSALLIGAVPGLVWAQEVHPKAGISSVTLLNVGLGPVGAALSEGLTAWHGTGDAVFWNPAAASFMVQDGPVVTLSGARLLGGVRQTALQYGAGWGGVGIALQVVYGSVGDIEIRGVEPTPEPLAIGTAHDLVAGVTVGLPLPRGGGLGIAVKGIYEKLHMDDAFGIAADAGIQLPLPVFGGLLRVGVAVRNLGSMGTMEHERPRLPWSLAAGIALDRPLRWKGWTFSAGGDVWKPADDWTQLRLGIEAAWDVLRLRMGTRQGKGWGTMSAGVGFALSGWCLDYAYIYDPDPVRQFLGSTQRIGVSLELGGQDSAGRQ